MLRFNHLQEETCNYDSPCLCFNNSLLDLYFLYFSYNSLKAPLPRNPCSKIHCVCGIFRNSILAAALCQFFLKAPVIDFVHVKELQIQKNGFVILYALYHFVVIVHCAHLLPSIQFSIFLPHCISFFLQFLSVLLEFIRRIHCSYL